MQCRWCSPLKLLMCQQISSVHCFYLSRFSHLVSPVGKYFVSQNLFNNTVIPISSMYLSCDTFVSFHVTLYDSRPSLLLPKRSQIGRAAGGGIIFCYWICSTTLSTRLWTKLWITLWYLFFPCNLLWFWTCTAFTWADLVGQCRRWGGNLFVWQNLFNNAVIPISSV